MSNSFHYIRHLTGQSLDHQPVRKKLDDKYGEHIKGLAKVLKYGVSRRFWHEFGRLRENISFNGRDLVLFCVIMPPGILRSG